MGKIIALLLCVLVLAFGYDLLKSKQRADFMRSCLENPFRTVEACEEAYHKR